MENNKLKKLKCNFDIITSDNGKNWFLALIWILIFEFTSSILEYEYLEYAKNYVFHMENGVFKELVIALFVVLFIWYCIYTIVFMGKNEFLILALISSVCTYLFITNDITFNLFLHNLNPFEIASSSFGFYMIVQLFLKLLTLYLFYKMLIAIRNRKLTENNQ